MEFASSPHLNPIENIWKGKIRDTGSNNLDSSENDVKATLAKDPLNKFKRNASQC